MCCCQNILNSSRLISMVFTKLLLENALPIRPCNCEAASGPLLPKVARCIAVLSSRCIGKCAARVLKRSGTILDGFSLIHVNCAIFLAIRTKIGCPANMQQEVSKTGCNGVLTGITAEDKLTCQFGKILEK